MNKLFLRASQDGKHIVGHTVPVEPKEIDFSEEEPRFVNITTAEPNEYQTALENEVLANAASRMADEHASNAKLARINATKSELAIRRKNREREKLTKKIALIENARPTCVIVLGIVGIVLGFILGASQVLRFHGPTMTIAGKALETILYLIVGAVFGCFFAWVTWIQFDNRKAVYEKGLDDCMTKIKELEAEERSLLEIASEYENYAENERRRSWEYRGFIDRKI